MAKDPAFPFYVNDWLSSPRVQRMNLAEQAAYLRLLCFCWASGDCSLPNDDAELREIATLPHPLGLGHPDDIADGKLDRCQVTRWDLILECFMAHPLHSHRLTNAKLLEIWRERQAFKEERSESGRKGATNRWGKSRRRKELGHDSSANSSATREPMAKDGSSSSSSSLRRSPLDPPCADDLATAQWMHALNCELTPGLQEPNFASWANTIRLMRQRDKRTDAEIRALYLWAHNDDFWRSNILCPAKLRQKWDMLKVKSRYHDGKPQADRGRVRGTDYAPRPLFDPDSYVPPDKMAPMAPGGDSAETPQDPQDDLSG